MKTEVEQLLYYSVPGFFIEFFVLLFLFLIGKPPTFDVPTVSFLVVATIPVGYIVYQAYVASPVYRRTWEQWFGGSDSNIQLIDQLVEKRASVLSVKLAENVKKSISSRYILNFLIFSEEKPEVTDYGWRLINLVNGRAVGIFGAIVSCFIPPSYLLVTSIHGFLIRLNLDIRLDIIFDQIPTELLLRYCLALLAYYLLLIAFVFLLQKKIKHIKESLVNFNQGAIISHSKKLDDLVSGYVALNAFRLVSKSLEWKKMSDTDRVHATDLLANIQEDLKNQKYDKATKTAEELHKLIPPTP